MATKIPVDAYIRVSRVGGREGDKFISPDLQRQSIERVCTREGLKVVKWFEELDASGGDASRPKWNEAIERVEQGKTRGIACWNLSRFSRSVKDALTAIERIEDAGGKLYSEEGDLGKLDRGFRLLIAEDERDRARAGFRNAVSNALARGVYIAARIPFGYVRDPETRKLTVDPVRAPILVQLFERRAKGQSWASLSDWLYENYRAETSTGKDGKKREKVARETIRLMINNPAYLGHARQGDLVNERAHEPLVSRLLWDKAHAAKGRKPVHSGASENILLRGIATCLNCGNKMVVGSTQGAAIKGKREKIPAYYCRNLNCDSHGYAKASEVDSYVVGLILSFLSAGKLEVQSVNPSVVAQAKKDAVEAQHALDTFKKNKKAITTLGVDAWNELLEEYVIARDSTQTTYEALLESNPQDFTDVPSQWNEWTTESRREFLGKVVARCAVGRGKSDIPDRVKVEANFTGADIVLDQPVLSVRLDESGHVTGDLTYDLPEGNIGLGKVGKAR